MDFKERKQYERQLEYFRTLQTEDEAIYDQLKQKNPKYIKEIKQSLKISGYHIELTTFEKPILAGFQRSDESIELANAKRQESLELRKQLQDELDAFAEKYPFVSKDDEEAMAELQAIKEKYKDDLVIRDDNARRKINKLKNKIQANFDIWTHFITLNYHRNMVDIPKSKSQLKEWFKRMNEHVPDFAYVYVMEFQERGSIHFHIICKCTKEDGSWFKNKDFKELLTIWKNGDTDVKAINQKYIPKKARDEAMKELQTDNEKVIAVWSLGSYLTSYLQKGSDNMMLFNSHMYGFSRGLKEPINITDTKKISQLLKYLKVTDLKENKYTIEIPETENKLTKQYYNALIKILSR